MEFICSDIHELDEIAAQLLIVHARSRVFAIYGKMGAGKTTFIKSLCKKLNVLDTAISPSFGIINEYKTTKDESVYHFDFYRIKNMSEFLDLGCEEYIYGDSYCFIEWPEKIEDYLPPDHVSVHMEEKDGKRFINF
jgi:tRNA threonylcarbamoyladenosine biosynthesis protein TsaE